MSIRTTIETAPLGATILVSNGKPQPPARFNRRLSEWKQENYVGTLTGVETRPGQRPHFIVREGAVDDTASIVFNRVYGFNTSLRFDVQRRPTPGMARVVRTSRRELLHIAGDHAAAVEWLANNLMSDAVIEVIADNHPESEATEQAA